MLGSPSNEMQSPPSWLQGPPSWLLGREDVDSSFVFFGKKEWNALPDNLKTLGNIDLFKVKLKQHFLSDY